MADKMAKKTATTENDNKEKIKKLIKEIEDLIKEKLGNKTLSKNNPFVVDEKIISGFPETLKKFGDSEEERNWIFYGPPGTGKTFALNKIKSHPIEYLINPKLSKLKSPIGKFVKQFVKPSGVAIDNAKKIIPYFVYLFLAKPFIKYGIQIFFNTYKPTGGRSKEHYFAILKTNKPDGQEYIVFEKSEWDDTLYECNNVNTNDVQNCYNTYKPKDLDREITFPPEIEKISTKVILDTKYQECIKNICLNVCREIKLRSLSVTKIVFHPSYTYEDFVGGIKPDLVQTKSNDQPPPTPPPPTLPPAPSESSSTSSLTYKYTRGVMLDLIRKAWVEVKDGVRHYFIIDEFNRGNITAIFGEFLYLIENDKRSEQKDSGDNYVFLPGGVYPWDDDEGKEVTPFSDKCKIRMPKNIFIVGALNTADRSIATMDFAMRRRFNFVKFEPKEELIEKFNWKSQNKGKPKDIDVTTNVKKLFVSLNKSINYKLDADHQIGHYYFMPTPESVKKDTETFLKDLFDQKIIPLLEAYCDHDEQAVKKILILTKSIIKKPEVDIKSLFRSINNSDESIKNLYGELINGVKPVSNKAT